MFSSALRRVLGNEPWKSEEVMLPGPVFFFLLAFRIV